MQTTLIEPRFNQLTIFDGRIPHAVRQVSSGALQPTATPTCQLQLQLTHASPPLLCFAPLLLWGQVEGVLDPREGRLVLHGWFTQPSPFFAGELRRALLNLPVLGCREGEAYLHGPSSPSPAPSTAAGALSEEEATPALNELLGELYSALGGLPPVVGCVSLRLLVAGDTGRVRDIQWLANTLVGRPQGGSDPWEAVQETLACIAEHCFEQARFPASRDGQPTHITLPFVFEL